MLMGRTLRAGAVLGVVGVVGLGVPSVATPLTSAASAASAAGPKIYACRDVGSAPQTSKDWPAPLSSAPSPLDVRLGVPDAQAAAPAKGRGYRVVIIDSGTDNPEASRGSVLGGIVHGTAPDAAVPAESSVWKKAADGTLRPDPDLFDAALTAAAAHANRRTIVLLGVPLESIGHRDDQALTELARAHAVLVDPVGVPPQDAAEPSTPPAGYDDADPHLPFANIVTVSVMPSSPTIDPGTLNVADSSTAFTLPTNGARSSVYGRGCVVTLDDPVYAAAEFAGMLALVASSDHGLALNDAVARLEATATGGAARSMYVGNGVPQPLAAIRYESPGKLAAPAPEAPAAIAAPSADVLASTKHHAIWWGLAGGGGLVLALLLRPLFTRRR